MTEIKTNKPYDLEERNKEFAKEVYQFINLEPKTLVNMEVLKQLVRFTGSVSANFIEANEALEKRFIQRVKICRKGAQESIYWLSLLQLKRDDLEKNRIQLS
jgi:four helix bundle protein